MVTCRMKMTSVKKLVGWIQLKAQPLLSQDPTGSRTNVHTPPTLAGASPPGLSSSTPGSGANVPAPPPPPTNDAPVSPAPSYVDYFDDDDIVSIACSLMEETNMGVVSSDRLLHAARRRGAGASI